MKAKLAYTYGWTDGEIESLPYRDLMQYWMAITVIEAERQLLNIEVACAPMMDKEPRKNLIRSYKQKCRMLIDTTDKKLASIKDVAKAFARMKMNG